MKSRVWADEDTACLVYWLAFSHAGIPWAYAYHETGGGRGALRHAAPMSVGDAIAAARGSRIYKNHALENEATETGIVTKELFHDGVVKGKLEEGTPGLVWCPSGGMTTTKRYYTPVARDEWRAEMAGMATQARQLEFFTESMTICNLCTASGRNYPTYEALQFIIDECGSTTIPCNGSDKDDYVMRIAERFKANTILATPNRLAQLAWHLQTEGRNYPVKYLIVYGTLPHEKQTSVMEAVFGSEMHGKNFPPAIAGVYGTAELGILGFSPARLRDLNTILINEAVWAMRLKPCSPPELPPSGMDMSISVYENQRKYPMVGFKSKLMNKDPPQWTDARLKPMRREEVTPPPQESHGVWAFKGEWIRAPRWLYAWDWNGPWMPEDELRALPPPKGVKRGEKPKIRRREWTIKLFRTRSPEELGAGRLLVTMLKRHCIPCVNYDTGDVAKPVHGGVKYMGDKYPALRLTQRQHLTFALGSARIFLSELDIVLSSRYVDYQVQHDYREDEGGQTNMVTVKVVPDGAKGQKGARDIDAETKKHIAMEIRAQLLVSRKNAKLPDYVLDIQGVAPHDLALCGTSGKLKRLIDVRGTGGVPPIVRREEDMDRTHGSDGMSEVLRDRPPSVQDMMSVADTMSHCGKSEANWGCEEDEEEEDEEEEEEEDAHVATPVTVQHPSQGSLPSPSTPGPQQPRPQTAQAAGSPSPQQRSPHLAAPKSASKSQEKSPTAHQKLTAFFGRSKKK